MSLGETFRDAFGSWYGAGQKWGQLQVEALGSISSGDSLPGGRRRRASGTLWERRGSHVSAFRMASSRACTRRVPPAGSSWWWA